MSLKHTEHKVSEVKRPKRESVSIKTVYNTPAPTREQQEKARSGTTPQTVTVSISDRNVVQDK